MKVCTVMPHNDGQTFAHNANTGIVKALAEGAEYICLLNDDTRTDEYFIEGMIKRDVDVCGAKIYDWNTRYMQPCGGRINLWTGQPKYLPGLNERPLDVAQYDHANLEWVNGCCMLIKRQVFEKIGLLDELFTAYFEDIDFCYRAMKAGLTIGMAPNAYVWHKGGQSSDSVFKMQNLTAGRIKFMRKHGHFKIFCIWYFGFYLWATLLWYMGKPKLQLAILRGLKDACS
jgi:GT2 family glycosyltransferase